MTRRLWLVRAARALPFLAVLPSILSRAPWVTKAIRWEWEERGLRCFATVVRLRTGELRATMNTFAGISLASWAQARAFHAKITANWVRQGAPLSAERMAAMRWLLAKPEIARSIRGLARRPPRL